MIERTYTTAEVRAAVVATSLVGKMDDGPLAWEHADRVADYLARAQGVARRHLWAEPGPTFRGRRPIYPTACGNDTLDGTFDRSRVECPECLENMRVKVKGGAA